MRQVEVYRNGILAGVLIEENRQQYVFRYNDEYFSDINRPALTLTLPKTQKVYISKFLFPYFSNLLSEGMNRKLQCRLFNIDEIDDFGLLMATALYDTIGAITVKPLP